MRARWIGAALAGACAIALGACNAGDEVLSGMRYLGATDAAQKAYPDLPREEAMRRVIIEKFNEAYAKAGTPEQQKRLAADFYLGFAMLHARAMPAYCKQMNLDLAGFTEEFRSENRNEEYAVDDYFEKQGWSREDLWKRQESRLVTRAKYQLMQLGGISTGSYGVCSALAKNPQDYAGNANFGALFPDISVVLTRLD